MFPTLSHLIKYLTGLQVALPVETFGFFLAVTFWLTYIAFKLEFKRKEEQGAVKPFIKKKIFGKPASVGLLLLYAIPCFIIGYKFVYCFQNYQWFISQPASFMFSLKGNVVAGLITAITVAALIYFQKKKQQLDHPVEVEELVHPYERTDRMLLWCAIVGMIGAVILAKLEYFGQLFTNPVEFLTTYKGLTFYGGLIFGAGIYLIRNHRMGIKLADSVDIGSPGMMLAYGVGRIACLLSGDGDWGKVNLHPKPNWLPQWAWASTYPHNVFRQGKFIEGCTDPYNYCTELTQPVYPTSLYEAVICIGLFAILWALRNRIKTPGLMFFIFIFMNGVERFFMEFIKTNFTYCIGNICLTQAQYISVCFMILGVAGFTWLYKKGKLKSES